MSRKIDALVAEKVMRWKPCTGACNGESCFWTDSDGSVWYHGGIVSFSPSVSIDETWEVVKKMQADGWGYELFNMTSSTQHEAEFMHPSDLQKGAWAETDSMQLSVCLAALRTVGVDEAIIQEAMKE